MKEWQAVSDVEKMTGIPNGTIRRYIRQHGMYLKVRKKHKSYEIHEDSIEILKEIRTLYGEGKNVDQIDDILSEKGYSMTVTIKNDHEHVTVDVGEVLSEIRKGMDDLKDFNRELIKRLDEREKYIQESLKKRDEQLMNLLRELQEQKQLASSDKGQDKKIWWKFWK